MNQNPDPLLNPDQVPQQTNVPQQSPVQYQNPIYYNAPPVNTGMLGIMKVAAVIAVIGFLATVFPFLASLNSSTESSRSKNITYENMRTVDEVNQLISRSSLFASEMPQLTCLPNESVYVSDKTKWMNDTLTCLNESWERSEGQTASGPYKYFYVREIIGYDEAHPADIPCKRDGIEMQRAAFYCRGNSTIYFNYSKSKNMRDDLSVVFHEFGHHIAFTGGAMLDAEMGIDKVFEENPAQEITLKQAETNNRHRSELFAECISMAVLVKNGLVNPETDIAWINEEKQMLPGEEGHMYGSTKNRTKIFDAAIKKPAVSTCNTWALSNADIE